jgi:hypothetical protein
VEGTSNLDTRWLSCWSFGGLEIGVPPVFRESRLEFPASITCTLELELVQALRKEDSVPPMMVTCGEVCERLVSPGLFTIDSKPVVADGSVELRIWRRASKSSFVKVLDFIDEL